MREPAAYERGPDGLPARVVGPWVDQKVHYVDRYATMFATGMKNRWARRAYVELFAGPGLSFDRRHHRFIDGSAIRSLDREFTDYVFVDIDAAAANALSQRIERRESRAGKAVRVFVGDCNAAVDPIRRVLPSDAITLAFIDPTTWQVTFEAISRLTAGRQVDLLFTFHAATMRRMVTADPPALTAFFGTADWRRALGLPREERTLALLRLYNERLQTIGYQPGSSELAVAVRNTIYRAIYHLVLFSKHPLGVDFWRKARAKTESGQTSIW